MKGRMISSIIAVVGCSGLLVAGPGLSQGNAEEPKSSQPVREQVKVLASYDVKEKLDGEDATVTIVEVTFGPGQASASHRHPGPTFVYVVEGTYELGIDDKPTKIYKVGQTFEEPSGLLHRVSRNPASTGKTKLIAVILHPRSAKDILTPADH